MKCYFCNSEMIVSGIDSKEELGLDGQGSVINFTCPKCDSTCEFIEGEKEDIKYVYKCNKFI